MNKAGRILSWRQPQRGVGLIEVLIAVLVVSIGFLGVAALQAMALSTNNSAMARSMATVAAYSIVDAMRIDRAAANAGSYNTTVTGNNCPAASGTLASTQLNFWCQHLASSLGPVASTTGTVSCASAGGGSGSGGSGTSAGTVCTVTVTFDDSRSGVGGSTNQTVTAKVAL